MTMTHGCYTGATRIDWMMDFAGDRHGAPPRLSEEVDSPLYGQALERGPAHAPLIAVA